MRAATGEVPAPRGPSASTKSDVTGTKRKDITMGYTQYWKHGTYRLDNGAFEDIEKLLKVSLDDAKKIVGEEAVDERVAETGRKYVWDLDALYDFEDLSKRYIYTNALGETAMFFDTTAALCMWYYLHDREICDISYSECCKPNHNALDDATLCAILIAISMHNPKAYIRSDGYWCEDNWQAGAKLYELACGVTPTCPENVALEMRVFFKGDEPMNRWHSNGSPAYLHVYQHMAHVYAPYDKALNKDFKTVDDATAMLIAHGYEPVAEDEDEEDE